MTESENLIKLRGIVKAKLTRAAKVDIPSLGLPESELWIEALAKIEGEFDTVQTKIELLPTTNAEDEEDPQMIERANFENTIFSLRAKLKRQLTDITTASSAASTVSVNSNAAQSTDCTRSAGPRIPKITLPIFSGKWDEWPTFFELFNNLVHNNPDIKTAIEKFYYLKLQLSGEAADHISTLQVTEANYAEALRQLKKRYENKRLIISNYLRNIFELPTVSSDGSLRSFVDIFTKSNNALVGLNANQWEIILLYLLSMKLAPGIRRQWELKNENSTQFPELTDFIDFLEQRASAAQVMSLSSSTSTEKKSNSTSTTTKRDVKHTHLTKTSTKNCPICQGEHYVFQCSTYNNASLPDREKFVTNHHLCRNCLSPGHIAPKCRSSKCKTCNGTHHTTLHRPTAATTTLNPAAPPYTTLSTFTTTGNVSTCLPTACVYAGNMSVRMLYDCASQCTLISENLVRRLKLRRHRCVTQLQGVGDTTSTSPQFATSIVIKSRHSPYELAINAKILPNITTYTPDLPSNVITFLSSQGLTLADNFEIPEMPIDILLGGEYFSEVMVAGKRTIHTDLPPLLNTRFGWIVSGAFPPNSPLTNSKLACCFTLEQQLRQFWEIEEAVGTVPKHNAAKLTADEILCEEIFAKTTTRDNTGRYVVRLPFRDDVNQLGESRRVAERQFYQIERRMQRDASYRENYHAFMREYERLGHMTPVEPREGSQYFVPHHAVTSPKFRVVFNGSQPTSTGLSLNDVLLVGPTVQKDLFTILNNFRKYGIPVTCDMEKMYRQVLVHPDHRRYQQILYRYSPEHNLGIFEINTVTNGISSASHQATRAVKQLAIDEGDKYPRAATILLDEDYIDDIATGAATIDDALLIVQELKELTSSGQFRLHKWNSNCPDLLCKITMDAAPTQVSFDRDNQISKVLGMQWRTDTDEFVFHANLPQAKHPLTKRQLLSHISRIFDPLGLVSPVVITAKCLLQKLWLQPIGWDDPLSHELSTQYEQLRQAIIPLKNLTIPRHIGLEPQLQFSLHGFCDASEDAYACCIYLKVEFENGTSLSHLLSSKTRVAPLKTVSIPRLELCGAVLLTRVFSQQLATYPCAVEQRFAYSDSTIALGWLAKPPRAWKTFVSNRVAEVCETLPLPQWRHVSSEHNSADIASRGVSATTLQNCELWWRPSLPPPISTIQLSETQASALKKEEKKLKVISLAVTETETILSTLSNRYSSPKKLICVLARVFYAISCFKSKVNRKDASQLSRNERLAIIPQLTVHQLAQAQNRIVRHIQEAAYPATFQRLLQQRPLKRRDPLGPLAPFIDSNGLLCVGGRLSNSNLPQATTHPILLPSKSHFVTSLIYEKHLENHHAGPKLLCAIMRQEFWVINMRDVIRRITRRCVTCRRFNGVPVVRQPTGNLPTARVTPSRPFSAVGIDFAGPISTRFSLARKATSAKSYIALFVCLATKALHLELVSDLSTEAFIAAFERFIGRRGLPADVYTDNGTNFVGAKRKISEIEEFLGTSKNEIFRYLATKAIKWHFIPPYAPNFGGLWEAGVKSTKRHLTSALNGQLLTFEEVTTVLIQIEACLNSRPLIPLSSDPTEAILTPGHFLIGDSLKASPFCSATPEKLTLTKRWRMTQQCLKLFWEAWSREYVATLQGKAQTPRPTPFSLNQIVLVKDEATPPLTWPLGKVSAIHPGKDGIVRVVTVRTARGDLKRTVSKLVPLDVDPQ